jgi:hypothetical protein
MSDLITDTQIRESITSTMASNGIPMEDSSIQAEITALVVYVRTELTRGMPLKDVADAVHASITRLVTANQSTAAD